MRRLSFALTLTTLLACAAQGQSGTATVTASGRVSGTVMLSVAPNAQLSDQGTMVSHTNLNPYTILVSIKISGSRGARRIAIPAQIRSNVGYTLSASAKKLNGTAPQLLLRGLRVTQARATGRFVASDAVEAFNRGSVLEAITNSQYEAQKASRSALVFPSPVTLLTGPRISLAGTSDSPYNALEVMILVETEAPAEATPATVELVLSAHPASVLSPALASR